MFKPVFTLTLLAVSLHAFGKHNNLLRNKHNDVTNTQSQSGNKNTGQESRLIAMSTWNYDGTAMIPSDSTRLTYTGENGWDHNLADWKYTSGKSWDYDGSNYGDAYMVARTFDGSNRVVGILGQVYDGSNWLPDEIEKYTFNTAGFVETNVWASYNGTGWDSSRSDFTYDAQGHTIEQIISDWDDMTSAWVKSMRFINIFNGAGLLESEITLSWNAGSSQWDSSYKTMTTYQGNKEATFLSQQYTSGVWEDSYKRTSTFDGAGNIIQTEGKNWQGSSWVNSGRTTNTYNSTNDLITEQLESYQGGAYVFIQELSYTYNSFKQKLTETRKGWDMTSSKFVFDNGSYILYSYYEEFNNGINKQDLLNGDMKVYPVPAATQLNVSVRWNKMQAATLVLYDVKGRLVKQAKLPAALNADYLFDISSLPSGIYVVKALGTDGHISQTVNITR
jgi:hypothetical protein